LCVEVDKISIIHLLQKFKVFQILRHFVIKKVWASIISFFTPYDYKHTYQVKFDFQFLTLLFRICHIIYINPHLKKKQIRLSLFSHLNPF